MMSIGVPDGLFDPPQIVARVQRQVFETLNAERRFLPTWQFLVHGLHARVVLATEAHLARFAVWPFVVDTDPQRLETVEHVELRHAQTRRCC